MLKKLKKLFYKYFDYDLVCEYFDTKGDGEYYKRYVRKYYLRCLKHKRKRGSHR